MNKQMLYLGIENALDYLKDIVSGETFGALDETAQGREGKSVGLSQIEMIRAAISALRASEGGKK